MQWFVQLYGLNNVERGVVACSKLRIYCRGNILDCNLWMLHLPPATPVLVCWQGWGTEVLFDGNQWLPLQSSNKRWKSQSRRECSVSTILNIIGGEPERAPHLREVQRACLYIYKNLSYIVPYISIWCYENGHSWRTVAYLLQNVSHDMVNTWNNHNLHITPLYNTHRPLRRTVSNTTTSEPSEKLFSPGLHNANLYIRRVSRREAF